MLSFWRTRKNYAVHLVFWPIIAVFVIWGFERYGNPVGGAAAIVNDRVISISQYRNAVQRMIEFYGQIFQGNFDEKMQEQYHIKETALKQLVDSELVSEQAQIMGLRVTDTEVRDIITDIPVLKKDGQFSRENYDNLLRYYHMTPAQFEDEQRRGLVMGKTMHLFDESVQPSSLQIAKEVTLRSDRKDVEFLKIDRDALAEKLSVSDSDVKDFLKDPKHVTEVKEYYDMHSKTEFSKPEEAQARHILIKAKKGDKAAESAAMEKVKKVQDELKTGNFADVAKKYSDDPGSKNKGGELGTFSRGRMVPEFEKAVFEGKVGETSAPVQTDYGFHIIQVEAKHPSSSTTLEEATNGIAKKLIAKDKISAAVDSADKALATAPQDAYKSLQSLDKGLKWEDTGMFSPTDEMIPKLGSNEAVSEAIAGLTESAPNAKQLVRNGSVIYALRLKKSEKVADVDTKKVTDELSRDYARGAYGAWSSSLRADAKIKINPQLSEAGGDAAPDDSGY